MVSELAAIFPDPYLHIGGDEVDDSQWKANPPSRVYARQQAGGQPRAAGVFQPQLETILEKHHRQMVGWDEIYHPDLPKSILIQSWQGRMRWGRWRRTATRAFCRRASISTNPSHRLPLPQ
jgi:hexosaminidase